MGSPFVDAAYLSYQYDNSEKFRIRAETHRLYTEPKDNFAEVELSHIQPQTGLSALDVGCGPGRLAGTLRQHGMGYVGLDRSFGLLSEAQTAADGQYLQGDALALPFSDDSFDRVISLGVLYHVQEWRLALQEIGRVARPGGRVVISTNGAGAMRRIYDLHSEAALELGYTPLPYSDSAFNLDQLPDVLSVFPSAKRYVQESALVFPESEPALRFYATNRIDMIEDWAGETGHRARQLPLMRLKIEAIIEREGCFRVPKSFGYFVADV
jgi:ubiquinone/menaquinone biosynthesis C-methylase UbiE